MSNESLPEVWLRGPLPDISAVFQPVAHALLQAREEVNRFMMGFPDSHLWDRPAGLASAGFHLQHLSGVLDRLLTYAKGNALSPEQLTYLAAEGKSQGEESTAENLVRRFNQQVEKALEQLRHTDDQTWAEFRGVGRAQLPSTVLGLMVHAAEHTQRHVGQLLVTARVVQNAGKS